MTMKRISDERIAVIGLLVLAVWLFVVLPVYHRPPPSMAVTPTTEECFRRLLGVCFVVPPESDGGIFGFAEFVQAFALLVLIFTVSGMRYQFRVETAGSALPSDLLEFRGNWSFRAALGSMVCLALSAPVVSFKSGILAIHIRLIVSLARLDLALVCLCSSFEVRKN